jgi:ABC-type lipoprotein export system ATPase subunit
MMCIINHRISVKTPDLVVEQVAMEIMNLMRDINKTEVTFLMVTHSLSLMRCATRAFSMENGKLSWVEN